MLLLPSINRPLHVGPCRGGAPEQSWTILDNHEQNKNNLLHIVVQHYQLVNRTFQTFSSQEHYIHRKESLYHGKHLPSTEVQNLKIEGETINL